MSRTRRLKFRTLCHDCCTERKMQECFLAGPSTCAQPAAAGQQLHAPIRITFKGFGKPDASGLPPAAQQQQPGLAGSEQRPKKKRKQNRDGGAGGAAAGPAPSLSLRVPSGGWDRQLADAAAAAAVAHHGGPAANGYRPQPQLPGGFGGGQGAYDGGYTGGPGGRPPKGQKQKKPRMPKASGRRGGAKAAAATAAAPEPRKPPPRKRKASARSQQMDDDSDYPPASPDPLRPGSAAAAPALGAPAKVSAAGSAAAAAIAAQSPGMPSAKPADSQDQVGSLLHLRDVAVMLSGVSRMSAACKTPCLASHPAPEIGRQLVSNRLLPQRMLGSAGWHRSARQRHHSVRRL